MGVGVGRNGAPLRQLKAGAFAVNEVCEGVGSKPFPEGSASKVTSLRPNDNERIARVGKTCKELASVTDGIDRD
jgi:hypothetical protein